MLGETSTDENVRLEQATGRRRLPCRPPRSCDVAIATELQHRASNRFLAGQMGLEIDESRLISKSRLLTACLCELHLAH